MQVGHFAVQSQSLEAGIGVTVGDKAVNQTGTAGIGEVVHYLRTTKWKDDP